MSPPKNSKNLKRKRCAEKTKNQRSCKRKSILDKKYCLQHYSIRQFNNQKPFLSTLPLDIISNILQFVKISGLPLISKGLMSLSTDIMERRQSDILQNFWRYEYCRSLRNDGYDYAINMNYHNTLVFLKRHFKNFILYSKYADEIRVLLSKYIVGNMHHGCNECCRHSAIGISYFFDWDTAENFITENAELIHDGFYNINDNVNADNQLESLLDVTHEEYILRNY